MKACFQAVAECFHHFFIRTTKFNDVIGCASAAFYVESGSQRSVSVSEA